MVTNVAGTSVAQAGDNTPDVTWQAPKQTRQPRGLREETIGVATATGLALMAVLAPAGSADGQVVQVAASSERIEIPEVLVPAYYAQSKALANFSDQMTQATKRPWSNRLVRN